MATSNWIELCEAAGFDISRMEIENIYHLSGKIIADGKLRVLCLVWMREHHSMNVLPAGLRVEILKSMTPTSRAELRERVSGVVKFKPKV